MSKCTRIADIVNRELNRASEEWSFELLQQGMSPLEARYTDLERLRDLAIERLRRLVPSTIPKSVRLDRLAVRDDPAVIFTFDLPTKLRMLMEEHDPLRPRFVNHCNRCRFLVHHKERDLYFCDGKGRPEVVAVGLGSHESSEPRTGIARFSGVLGLASYLAAEDGYIPPG